jgi:hypothetical protein
MRHRDTGYEFCESDCTSGLGHIYYLGVQLDKVVRAVCSELKLEW